MLKHIAAGVLDVAYEETGAVDGIPVVLLHGFPYDVHAFDEVSPRLAARGCRVIAPYLRGYGPTRFLSASTPRSGQQAVLGHDLLALMDALAVPASRRIAGSSASCSGGSGPRTGASTTRPMSGRAPPSTIPISWRS